MRYEYKILLFAGMFCQLGDSLIGPFYAIWVKKITTDPLIIGSSIALYSFLAGLFIIFFGKLSDRYDKKELFVLFGYFLLFIATVLYLFISAPWQLYVQSVLTAIGIMFLSGPLKALMSKSINADSAGFQWSLDEGSNKIVSAISITAGAFIVKYFGFTVVFVIMASLQFVSVVLLFGLYIKSRNKT
jgi:MFS family permease